MTLPIPPGEPPADEVAAALADLAAARAERDAAAHVIALIRINGPEGGAGGGLFLRRREIELQVAETRLQLWAGEVRQTEAAVRRLGIRP